MISSPGPRLLAIGGAHIDRRGQVTGDYMPGASNPGVMREDVGGGAFNALRTAARRGARAVLISMRGGDAAGDIVARAIAAEGIADLSAIFLDRTTASYTALVDRDGAVIAGLADMGLYELAFPKQVRRSKLREAVADADGVLVDANLPEAALKTVASAAREKPLFAIAVSPAKAVRLKPILKSLDCLFMNRREAAALTGLSRDAEAAAFAARFRELGLRAGAITSGGEPVAAFAMDETFAIQPPPPRKVVDETGAGDALAGATAVAILSGQSLRTALREGIAAALLTIESPTSVPDLTPERFAGALALVPEAARVS
jgi:pseudouridine kinase